MTPEEKLQLLKLNAVISVVDDDESVRKSLQRLLRSMGFQVETFSSAIDFLNRGQLQAFGCAIVDVRMPVMNGLALQKTLGASGISLPVVFITAHEDPGVKTQALEGGAFAFLQKPFSDPSLIEAISSALESQTSAMRSKK